MAQRAFRFTVDPRLLAADRVMRVGDRVKFEDVQGTVERIGLRSTHVRTLDPTVVKVPNGRLAAVRLVELGEYSLDVTVNAWFATTNFAEFEIIRQDILLAMIDIVERAGTRLAIPMQVLRIEQDGADGSARLDVNGTRHVGPADEQGTIPSVTDR